VGVALHHDVAKRDLPVAADCDVAFVLHGQDGS
jgi:hypothetical protein